MGDVPGEKEARFYRGVFKMLRVHALVFVISILGRVQSHGGIYNYTIGEVQYAG